MLYGVSEHSYTDLSLSFPSFFTSSDGSINRTQSSVVVGDIGFNNVSWGTWEIIPHPYLFAMTTFASQEVKDATDAYILVRSDPSVEYDAILNVEGTSIFTGDSTTGWRTHYVTGLFSVDMSDVVEGACLKYISSGGGVNHRFEYHMPNALDFSDTKFITFVIKSSQIVPNDANFLFYIHDGVYERRWYLGTAYPTANEWQQFILPIANFNYEPTGHSINMSQISMVGVELITAIEPLTLWIDDIELYDELTFPQVQLFFNNHLVLSEKIMRSSFGDVTKISVPTNLLKGQNNVSLAVDAHISQKVYSIDLVLLTHVNQLDPIWVSNTPFLFMIFALEVIITCYALLRTYRSLIHLVSND